MLCFVIYSCDTLAIVSQSFLCKLLYIKAHLTTEQAEGMSFISTPLVASAAAAHSTAATITPPPSSSTRRFTSSRRLGKVLYAMEEKRKGKEEKRQRGKKGRREREYNRCWVGACQMHALNKGSGGCLKGMCLAMRYALNEMCLTTGVYDNHSMKRYKTKIKKFLFYKNEGSATRRCYA